MKAPEDAPKAKTRTVTGSGTDRAFRPRDLSSGAHSLRERVYQSSDLSYCSPGDRLIIDFAEVFFYSAIGAICSTLRWQVRGREYLDRILAAGGHPIFTFWHECIFSATYYWRNRGIVVMSSTSRDAEYTGRVIKRFGYGTARGSSTRGGGRALAEMAQCLSSGIEVAFTIDGPRGPARVAKTGAITLARHTGQAILPFHVALSKFHQLPSWDRLQIPMPFSRATVLIAQPIYVSRGATPEEVAEKQALLQETLDALSKQR